MQKILVHSIEWETDGEPVKDLPTSVEIEIENLEDPHYEICEYLSDHYGWLVSGYEYRLLNE